MDFVYPEDTRRARRLIMVVACGAHAGQAKEQCEGVTTFFFLIHGVTTFLEKITLPNEPERHPTIIWFALGLRRCTR